MKTDEIVLNEINQQQEFMQRRIETKKAARIAAIETAAAVVVGRGKSKTVIHNLRLMDKNARAKRKSLSLLESCDISSNQSYDNLSSVK